MYFIHISSFALYTGEPADNVYVLLDASGEDLAPVGSATERTEVRGSAMMPGLCSSAVVSEQRRQVGQIHVAVAVQVAVLVSGAASRAVNA